MSHHLFPFSSAPTATLRQIHFGVFSPEEITRYSVAEIKFQETYENRRPKPGGLLDPHMGCVDGDSKCLTCDEKINHCVGHFGHLPLARPVFHVGFLSRVKKILETICIECSRPRIPYSDEPTSQYQTLANLKRSRDKAKYAWDHSKQRHVCESPSCGKQLLPIRKHVSMLFLEKRKTHSGKTQRVPLSAMRVRDILAAISDEDCRLIGINPTGGRPEWLILTVLPVPPPSLRPSISMDNSGRGEDDLTHKLSDIIKYNNLLKKQDTELHVPRSAVEINEEQLQYHINAYIANDSSGNPPSLQKSGKPTRSIQDRLKGKEGRFRGNLQGKRVDHAARTVITGDPNLDIDEVGVPKSIARNLTFPERVNRMNVARLQRAVDSGSAYPGAKYVFTKDETLDLRYTKGDVKLKDGDVVERHLTDGDWLIFNRQPTLHKPSMMGHRVRVMPHSTFRLNLSVTTPYNADFGKYVSTFPLLMSSVNLI